MPKLFYITTLALSLLSINISTSFAANPTKPSDLKQNSIDTSQIQFQLIPNEPGPEWSCTHEPVAILPSDWRVNCQSLTSTAQKKFLVHFIMRTNGFNATQLEILYWVDELNSNFKGKLSQSHGQSSLIEFSSEQIPQRLSLGQFVENGTSSLNILYQANRR